MTQTTSVQVRTKNPVPYVCRGKTVSSVQFKMISRNKKSPYALRLSFPSVARRTELIKKSCGHNCKETDGGKRVASAREKGYWTSTVTRDQGTDDDQRTTAA